MRIYRVFGLYRILHSTTWKQTEKDENPWDKTAESSLRPCWLDWFVSVVWCLSSGRAGSQVGQPAIPAKHQLGQTGNQLEPGNRLVQMS